MHKWYQHIYTKSNLYYIKTKARKRTIDLTTRKSSARRKADGKRREDEGAGTRGHSENKTENSELEIDNIRRNAVTKDKQLIYTTRFPQADKMHYINDFNVNEIQSKHQLEEDKLLLKECLDKDKNMYKKWSKTRMENTFFIIYSK